MLSKDRLSKDRLSKDRNFKDIKNKDTQNNIFKIGFNEFASLKVFYVITMKLKTNKTMYLQIKDIFTNKKNELVNVCEWVANRQDALYFEDLESAENFARDYFKNFKEWKVESFTEIW